MAFRRRRRKKYTWFPTNGTEITRTGQTTFVANPETWQISMGNGVDVAHVIRPLILSDYPVEEADAGDTLNDIVGNEYVVERIVGHAFGLAYAEANPNAASIPNSVLMSFGIFVARADGNNPLEPIGAATATTTEESSRNYNPLDNQTVREPWMFRRSWVLATQPPTVITYPIVSWPGTSQGLANSRWPQTTAHYLGANTGPFVDVKSVRRVRQDERLWGVMSMMPYPVGFGGPTPDAFTIRGEFTFDYRILGALRKSKNRSNF